MYPNVYFALKDLFGNLPGWLHWLRFINSFGFFVALSFIAAAVTLTKELMRKEREGVLHYTEEMIWVGKPASPTELSLNFLLGFLLGFKVVGLITADPALTNNVQEYLISMQGSWVAGIIGGLLMAGLKLYETNKHKLPQPQEKKVRIWPHDRVGDLTIYAFIFGFIGAKIFNSLETWDDFVKDPFGSLFSFSGLTFYGGLICAAIAIWIYARKHNIGFWHLNDAAAPGLMLAYAIGRVGCQVSGDGDWGVLNSSYITDQATSKAVLASPGQVMATVKQHSYLYLEQFHTIDKVPHLFFKAPSWLPDWLFAYAYPHNVNGVGAQMVNCNPEYSQFGQYCRHLPVPVFPTPIYETITCLILFFILWRLRKRLHIPGMLFGVYLILNGIERFLVEHIRVNTTYDIFGFHPTQAELISSALIIAGAWIFFDRKRKGASEPPGKGGIAIE
jgi:phosphatidylglycerol:prolipoprotein diacylglycerol transferase